MPRRTHRLALALLAVFAVVTALAVACGSNESAPAAAEASSAAAGGESITNNQEAGVDEGGIVKAWGDYLIVLRRGRLFTVRVGADDLTPVCMANAFPDDESLGSWYDEMLVHDKTVVVIGYSYQVSATEIGVFDLDDQGCIAHRATHFLRSNDYYSTRNYASRLVDGKLVFYMPHYLGSYRIENEQLEASADPPAIRTHGRGSDWRQIITSSEIHMPTRPANNATLHTVVTCDLASRDLSCHAHAILGEAGRTFYVSPNAVYVWVHDGSAGSIDEPHAEVYRLPLDGSAPGALRAWGVPTDQFSFKEDAQGTLNVLVRGQGAGDWMGGPEGSTGSVALVSLPETAFASQGISPTSPNAVTALPFEDDGRTFQNRFVGDYVLYGTGMGWGYASDASDTELYAHALRNEQGTTRIALRHGVDRIEALGRHAVVIGSDGADLRFSSIALGSRPWVVDRYTQENAVQGETRSHGFFFHPESERAGTLGLPIRGGQGAGYEHLFHGSASVLFLDVKSLRFRPLGALTAHDDRADDRCQVSCVDWYGNARPIFYRGRVFALLGYELVEGIVRRGRIVEVDRAHLYSDLRS